MQTPSTSGTASARTVSLAIAIILLIVGVAAGTAVGYFGIPRTTTTRGICDSGKTVTIGELLDLSKDLANQGLRAKRSSEIAIADINSFLTTTGCNLKFATQVDDYQLDSTLASTDLASFNAAGIQVVVGPLNSGAAATILQYADSNHIVLISPSSTSVALAIPNDYLFRTAPNDRWQGQADARMMRERGATDLIIVQRHDAYGDALANATKAYFQLDGGHVENIISYSSTGVSDWTSVLDALNTAFNAATTTGGYTASHVAIDVIAFEEFGSMILKAQSSYGSFPWSTLPWFGTDGEAQDNVIVNATYGGPVAQVKLPSTVFGFVNNSKTVDLETRYIAKYPSDTCDIYCKSAYDDVWLGALAVIQAGTTDGAAIQAALPTVARNYFGVTGPTLLEASGDRVATTYQIWKVVTQGTAQAWVFAGEWDAATDAVTWTSPP